MSALRLFYHLIGKRIPPINCLTDMAEIIMWDHPDYLPAQHIALKIIRHGAHYYLSFSPSTRRGLEERSNLRSGVPGYFVENFEDDLLIQGVRLSPPKEQKEIIDKPLNEVTVIEILANAKQSQHSSTIKQYGRPQEVIQLHHLDLDKMIEKIKRLKSTAAQWAAWSGTYFHKPNSYNCASVVLDVLYEGGLGHLISAKHDLLGIAGMLLGIGYVYFYSQTWIINFFNIALGILIGRGVGGMLEGYIGIQSFLNLTARQHKDDTPTLLGLRILSTCFSAFIGLVKPGPVIPAFLTLPRDIMNLAQQAKMEEESLLLRPQLKLT